MFIDRTMLWYTWVLPLESFPWLLQKQQCKSSVHTGDLDQKLPGVLPLDIPILIKKISGKLKTNNTQNKHEVVTEKAITNLVSSVNFVFLTENFMC